MPPNPKRTRSPALDLALRGLANPTYRGHDRRLQRLVAAYRSRHSAHGRIPLGFLPLEDLRLDVLTYRWGQGAGGGPRPRVPLATYRPVALLPGPGRIRFDRIRVRDAASRRAMADEPDAARVALALHRAALHARDEDWGDELALPRFYAAFDPRDLGRHRPLDPDEVDIDGLRAWPLEGHAAGESHHGHRGEPVALFARLDHLRGRLERNPAAEVLTRLGVLMPRGEPDGDELARFRGLLEVLAADPDLEARVRRELADACHAAAIPLAGGWRGDDATAMIADPRAPVAVPDAGRPVLVRLAGPPGPDTAVFANDAVAVDLADLGAVGSLDGFPRALARAAMGGDRPPCRLAR